MIIERKKYLNKLISKKDNGLIKVITGIRRCGKSFLLFELYHEYLNSVGVTDDCIIEIALDEVINAKYKNPFELDKYIREVTEDKSKRFYVFITTHTSSVYQSKVFSLTSGSVCSIINTIDLMIARKCSC